MCLHSPAEVAEYEAYVARRYKGRLNPIATVIMRDPVTDFFQEAYFVDATDKQQIANVIRNLRAWHPGNHRVDLSEVNKRRSEWDLYSVSERDLPKPTGKAPPSEDPSISVAKFADSLERTRINNLVPVT